MESLTSASVSASAPAPASASTSAPAPTSTRPDPAAALLECRLCELQFNTHEEKRQHAKSDWHVYQIRRRVAEPEATVTPPNEPSSKSSSKEPRTRAARLPSPVDDDKDEGHSSGSERSEKDIVEFKAEQCLFCSHTSKDFDANLAHMAQAHSLVVPFQSLLAVDLQTLVWYLHMVIFSYRECICCGKRRRTTEAVQQHMISRGHCRFDIDDDMSEFYHMDSLASQMTEMPSDPDDMTLRLPSGKTLGHRSYMEPALKHKSPTNRSSTGAAGLPESESAGPLASQALTKKDRQEQALVAQFSQLRAGDRTSLAHLPQSQQRALLLTRKKALDKAKRAEVRKGGRMDHVGNKTAIHTNYYKQEVPVYMGG
jgi:pre-60S factor REI1